jgi:hypothetical protein
MSKSKQNIKEVSRYIIKEVECELWARVAGRRQFNGCNRILYMSLITQEQVNISEKEENIARNQKSDTKIHGVDGKIRAGNSYGNDPCPPKDKK